MLMSSPVCPVGSILFSDDLLYSFQSRIRLSVKQLPDKCEEGRMSASGKIPGKVAAVQIALGSDP